MAEFEFLAHAKAMMRECNIAEEWAWQVIETGRSKREKDGNIHYTKTAESLALKFFHAAAGFRQKSYGCGNLKPFNYSTKAVSL